MDCDFNNVYIWTKFKGDITDTTFITDDLSVRKVTTAEPIIVSALDVSFVPCLSGAFGNTNSCIICENGYDYRTKDKITGDLVGWDPNVENVIEIVKDSNSIITPEKIKNNIINVMRKFFDPAKHTIGGNVDFNKLQSDMLAVGGVKGIRTVYTPTGTNTRMVFNGLSFASWTEKLATGEDKQIVKGNIQVKAFQFPKLVDDLSLKLEKRIKIVFESFNSTRIDF